MAMTCYCRRRQDIGFCRRRPPTAAFGATVRRLSLLRLHHRSWLFDKRLHQCEATTTTAAAVLRRRRRRPDDDVKSRIPWLPANRRLDRQSSSLLPSPTGCRQVKISGEKCARTLVRRTESSPSSSFWFHRRTALPPSLPSQSVTSRVRGHGRSSATKAASLTG